MKLPPMVTNEDVLNLSINKLSIELNRQKFYLNTLVGNIEATIEELKAEGKYKGIVKEKINSIMEMHLETIS
jgi:hypothetical protein